MNFLDIAMARQSCRKYDTEKPVEQEKLMACLEAARLAPSACNGQPYHFTVCRGELAKKIAKATMDMKINRFADQAPVLVVVSEEPYCKMAGVGAKLKHNDYRSMDIGIAVAYFTAQAAELGLGTCILGWLDGDEISGLCGLEHPARLVLTVGYPAEDDVLREKKRKTMDELVTEL